MNLKKFRNADFRRPTDTVDVPELAGWMFEDGETPVLTVRGLTANQLFVAYEAMQKNSLQTALVEAVQAFQLKGNAEELKGVFARATGTSEEEPVAKEVAFRCELIRFGVQDGGKPVFNTTDAVKLGEHFPEVFQRLSSKILKLSGEGSSVGER